MKKYLYPLIFLSVLLSCSGPETVDLGMIVSVSGEYSPLLSTARNGALLAVEEINKNNKNLQIKLIVEDDESNADIALRKSEKLVEEGIEYIMMSVTSGNYAMCETVLTGSDSLILSPTVSSGEFSQKNDNFIRFVDDTTVYARAFAEYVIGLGVGDSVIIYDSNNLTYAENLINVYIERIRTSIKDFGIHLIEFDTTDSPSFTVLGSEILSINPETVFIIASAFDAALICQHIQDGNIQKLIAPWAVSAELIQNGGSAVEEAVTYYKDETMRDEAGYKKFETSYIDRFETEPTYQSMKNYETVMFFYNILRTQKDPSPAVIKDAIIKSGGFEGLNFIYKIDEYGDCSHPIHPYVIKNGEFVSLDNS